MTKVHFRLLVYIIKDAPLRHGSSMMYLYFTIKGGNKHFMVGYVFENTLKPPQPQNSEFDFGGGQFDKLPNIPVFSGLVFDFLWSNFHFFAYAPLHHGPDFG